MKIQGGHRCPPVGVPTARTQELNAIQQELQRSLRMRDEFMSLVAHELRTPLNMVSSTPGQGSTFSLVRGCR